MKTVLVLLKNKEFQEESRSLCLQLKKSGVSVLKKVTEKQVDVSLVLTDRPETYRWAKENRYPVLVCITPDNTFKEFRDAVYFAEGLEELDYDYLNRVYEREKGIPHVVCETARLKIQEISLDNLAELYSLYDEPGLEEFLPLPDSNREEEAEYLKRYIKTVYAFDDYGSWLIFDRDTQKVVGRISLTYEEGYQGLELGYLVKKEFRRNGYALEACRALIEYVRKKEDFFQIRVTTVNSNTASIKLAEKLLFERGTEEYPDNNRKVCFILKLR